MNFVKDILSSDTEQGSFSRLSGLLIILALIIWASWITWQSKVIPDIPYYWLVLVLGLYGINKTMEAAKIITATVKGEAQNADQPAQ